MGCRAALAKAFISPRKRKFLSSSAVEQSAVNRSVVGSIPTSGATLKGRAGQAFGLLAAVFGVSASKNASNLIDTAPTRLELGHCHCPVAARPDLMQPSSGHEKPVPPLPPLAGDSYYAHDAQTGKQENLRMRSRIAAKNAALVQPELNLALNRTPSTRMISAALLSLVLFPIRKSLIIKEVEARGIESLNKSGSFVRNGRPTKDSTRLAGKCRPWRKRTGKVTRGHNRTHSPQFLRGNLRGKQ